jgi:hypothetical protein
MKYLGIPVTTTKLYTADLMYVELKVVKRLPTWQSLMVSSRGKSILIESSLSSLPNYIIGVYLLLEEVHHKMDSARANFYWDSGQRKKYHMVKWVDLARPKDLGGLEFTDTRLMNKCFLSKLIIKLERGDTDLCTKMLRNKYLNKYLSSGKACMRLSSYVRVGSSMRLAMGINLGFGMKSGWESVR